MKTRTEKSKETREIKVGKILSLPKASISADGYQYILNIESHQAYYFSSLPQLLESYLDIMMKEKLVANKQKDIEGVINTIEGFKKWAKKVFKALDNPLYDQS